MSDPAFYQQGGDSIVQAQAALAAAETRLATTYGRWEALESRT